MLTIQKKIRKDIARNKLFQEVSNTKMKKNWDNFQKESENAKSIIMGFEPIASNEESILDNTKNENKIENILNDIKEMTNENKEMKSLIRFIIAEMELTRNINKSREVIKNKFYKIYPEENNDIDDIVLDQKPLKIREGLPVSMARKRSK